MAKAAHAFLNAKLFEDNFTCSKRVEKLMGLEIY